MAEDELAAGDFSAWLRDMRAALRGERDSDVPCDGCTACCTSSQFVHVGPGEKETLARIPRALLFPAPGLPQGHVLMGYDGHGRCPMLVEDRCSIYEHRPRACRTYDCRVFAAAGVEPEADKRRIGERARRWRFEYPTDADRAEHDAVRAAAAFVQARDGGIANPTELAVRAVEGPRAFLDADGNHRRSDEASP